MALAVSENAGYRTRVATISKNHYLMADEEEALNQHLLAVTWYCHEEALASWRQISAA